jgi:(2R)-ethylmalonyl-CoA mutase
VLSKNTRARAIQLPAWNEALGLPRPWDQQWSLRLQQIMAYETDLMEFDDIFEGSQVIRKNVEALKQEARGEMARIAEAGGVVVAIESSYMKQQLVASGALRLAQVESGELPVVGVNCFTETHESPLTGSDDGGFFTPDPKAEAAQIKSLEAWRESRDGATAATTLDALEAAAREGRNIMESSIACAHAGVTTGEWAGRLREVFGEYQAPTGVGAGVGAGTAPSPAMAGNNSFAHTRERVEDASKKLGRRLKMLVGKPGLDGHSNGAEQISVRARDAGFEVVYEGIRLTPSQIVNTALEEGVHVIGLSVLSGSHLALVGDVMARMKEAQLDVPLVVGGIIPPRDARKLKKMGVAVVYTPKDFHISRIMTEIVDVIERAHMDTA